jgi:hypothetical protein
LDIYGYYSLKIINILINNILNLSISKYSSNVILFLLDYLKKNNFFKFLDCLKIIFIDENNFKEMIKNKFSSFVIEKSFQIILNIEPDFFNNNIIYLKDVDYNYNSSDSSNDKEDEKMNENENNDMNTGNGNNKKENTKNTSIMSYDKYIELKKKYFIYLKIILPTKKKKK